MLRIKTLKIILVTGFLLTPLPGRLSAEMKDAPKTIKQLHGTLSELKQSVQQTLQEKQTLTSQVQALRKQLKELQDNCPHEETEVLEISYMPGHSFGISAFCKRCEKEIK